MVGMFATGFCLCAAFECAIAGRAGLAAADLVLAFFDCIFAVMNYSAAQNEPKP